MRTEILGMPLAGRLHCMGGRMTWDQGFSLYSATGMMGGWGGHRSLFSSHHLISWACQRIVSPSEQVTVQ